MTLSDRDRHPVALPQDPIVRVEDVFVAFRGAAGAVMALRGADLSVAPGERLVVQGPNGSGKSTLLRVITGEQAVVAGTVQVGGAALHELGTAQRRRWRAQNVGFIDQHAHRGLLSEQHVIDNVALQLRLTGMSGAAARRRAQQTLDALGVGELAERTVPELSGGEAQRVAICAAVAHGPQLVLADEPTGELDEDSARSVYQMLSRIAADGASVILVSHDPRSVSFADRAIRVRDGRVAEQWRPREGAVAQVPDSRGWVRVPPELIPHTGGGPAWVASARPDGVLLCPRPADVTSRGRPADQPPVLAEGLDSDRLRHGWPSTVDDAPLAELAEVSAGYPGRQLFGGLDLLVRGGDWVVVVGPSGSGKSTLLSLIAGLVDPTAGQVSVGGTAWSGIARTTRAGLRRRWLAMAPQRPSMVEALTVRENLDLTRSVRGMSGSPGEVTAAADRLGLTALLGQPVSHLSGGERQRVAIARCLVSGAPLLVLDEPTSQQDEASAARVIKVLSEETAAGRAIVSASHDLRLTEQAGRTVDLDGRATDS